MKKLMIATIFICGSIAMLTSCEKDKTLPKCYDLIADEYKEIPADEMIYYSPAVATPEQLKGFPTTFLIVGTLDLFVHEDLAFVEQLKKAGVEVDSFVESGVPYSYNVILNDSPQTIRFKNLRDEAVKKMFK